MTNVGQPPQGPLNPEALLGFTGGPRWWRRLQRVRGVRPVLAVWLLLAVAMAAAFVLAPSSLAPTIPGDDALGTLSTVTIKAPRDTDLLDAETTELKRDEAARTAWPVYRYDAGAGPLLQARIAAAFAQGRAALEEWQWHALSKAARSPPAQAERPRAQAAARRKPQAEEAELLAHLSSRKDEFLKALQAVVDDEDYLALARSGFDPQVERAAVRLAGLVSTDFAVEERELLAADRERGITVRPVNSDGRLANGPERLVRDIDRIRDLSQIRAEVDRLAPEQLADLPPAQRRAVADLVRRGVRPNLIYDEFESRLRVEQKRQAVREVILQIKKGERILGDGEVITKQHLLAFRALREAGRGGGASQIRWGSALLAAVVCVALFEFGRRNVLKFRVRSRDLLLLAALLLLQLWLVRGALAGGERLHDLFRDGWGGRWSSPLLAEFLAAAVPVAAGSMLVRYLVYSEAALLWTAVYAPLCGLLFGAGLQPAVVALVAGVVAADRVGNAGSRASLFLAGVWSALAAMAVHLAFALLGARLLAADTAAQLGGAALGGALLTPIIVLLVAPVCEVAFGVVTDVRLLELASLNHPLLKDLIVQAPGTYHHSIVLGRIVEVAAREIGANPLLARVGAYYRDIGKGRNPLYFGENQRQDNRHDQITPQTSAEIIRRHVDDGIALAREAHLPGAIIDFIPQHHGTRVIGYFFHKAKELAERTGEPPPAEDAFRYAGPKPQSREAALLMIGEAVVASSRGLSEGPLEGQAARLRQLVDRAVEVAWADGQLDECDLTTRDLARVKEAFVGTMLAVSGAQRSSAPTPRPPALRVVEPAPEPAPEPNRSAL